MEIQVIWYEARVAFFETPSRINEREASTPLYGLEPRKLNKPEPAGTLKLV